jgi:quinol-cytochrome oxidoreductase complex cytochrome b subunit
MNWSKWIRQTHRWLSITFTVLVIVNIVLNFVVPAPEQLALWVGILTLLPLALLMLTGVYLFVLPYATRWRAGRHAAE